MLVVNSTLSIPREEFTFSFARAGGPGGQNVNKVSSKVTLRWRPAASPSLAPAVKERFLAIHGGRLTKEGDVLVISQRHRDQGRNVEDCLEKLKAMLLAALRPPKKRKPTRPGRAARERRLHAKKLRAKTKADRRERHAD